MGSPSNLEWAPHPFDGFLVMRNLISGSAALDELEKHCEEALGAIRSTSTVEQATDDEKQGCSANQMMLLGQNLPPWMVEKIVQPMWESYHERRLLEDEDELFGDVGEEGKENDVFSTKDHLDDLISRAWAAGLEVSKQDDLPPSKVDSRQVFPTLFDSCIVNRYAKGSGIKAHADLLVYGEIVMGLSLRSRATMVLSELAESALAGSVASASPSEALVVDEGQCVKRGMEQALSCVSASTSRSSGSSGSSAEKLGTSGHDQVVDHFTGRKMEVELRPGDLYILAGSARYRCAHEILPVEGERLSVTLRMLRAKSKMLDEGRWTN